MRYLTVNQEIQRENNLSVDYGAWIIGGGHDEPAINSDSVAEKAGLRENDIISEFSEEKITGENSLAQIIVNY